MNGIRPHGRPFSSAIRPLLEGRQSLVLVAVAVCGVITGHAIASQNRILLLLIFAVPPVLVALRLSTERLVAYTISGTVVLTILTPPWFDLSYVTGRISDERFTVPRLVLVAQVGVLMVIAMRAVVRREGLPPWRSLTAIDLFFAAWVAMACLSVGRSLDPTTPKWFLQTVLFAGLSYVFARSYALSRTAFLGVMRVLLVCSALLAATILFEAVTHVNFVKPGTVNLYSLHVYQATGILAHPSTTAFVLIQLIPLTSLFWGPSGRPRRMAFAFSGLLAFCLFLTFSRSALIGLLAGAAAYFPWAGKTRKLATVALLAVILCALAYPWISSQRWFTDRIMEEDTAEARVIFASEAKEILLSLDVPRLLFGIGYDNFRHWRHLNPAMWDRASQGYIRSESNPTHNTHLTILLEMGLIALAAWSALHIAWLRRLGGVRHDARDAFALTLSGALFVSEVSFLVGCNGHTMTPDYSSFALFWLLMGTASHPAGPLSRRANA